MLDESCQLLLFLRQSDDVGLFDLRDSLSNDLWYCYRSAHLIQTSLAFIRLIDSGLLLALRCVWDEISLSALFTRMHLIAKIPFLNLQKSASTFTQALTA